MILEVHIQIFGAPTHAHQSFNFQQIQGGPNINILKMIFFVHFQKYQQQKNICASIVFIAESKAKT